MRVGRTQQAEVTYHPTPIVRSINPEQSFEETFVTNKFSMTKHVVLVPILSEDEATEYKLDPPAFRVRCVVWLGMPLASIGSWMGQPVGV